MRGVNEIDQGSLLGILESLLLVSTDAVSTKELARAAGAELDATQLALERLASEYADANRGIQLREVAGGWRLYTHPAYHDVVEAYIVSWDKRKLSQAALETLAVIAYYQPVTRDGVRNVRGVNSDGVIASLKEKGLVREVGKDERQAAMFGTTNRFLETFGLRGTQDLPPLEDFAPDEASRQFIRDRLAGTAASVIDEEDERDLRDVAEDEGALTENGVYGTGDEGDA